MHYVSECPRKDKSARVCVYVRKSTSIFLMCVGGFACLCATGVRSHYILQPSPALSLLLKPVVSKELLLPCSLPLSTQDPEPDAMQTMQVSWPSFMRYQNLKGELALF